MNHPFIHVRRSAVILAVVFAMVVSLVPSVLNAQVASGSIQGTVKDPSGAVVASATVTVVNNETAFTRAATTDANGLFSLLALPLGPYKLTVQAKGFASYSETIQVTVGSRLEREIALTVGTTATTVEVFGAGIAVVNTINQEVSSVVTSEEIRQLPTFNRNPYQLVATAANVQRDSQAGTGEGRGAGFSINGQRSANTSILLDGNENVNQFTSTVGQEVPLDSMQEFRVVTGGMTAEYGRASGGVVNVATKSGSNIFHGSAYEFNRISALSSNTYFNVANGNEKAVYTYNQFGFALGGPIVKNKLFFFANPEWRRIRSSAPWTTLVPDPAFIAAADPATQDFFSAFGTLRTDLTQGNNVYVEDLGFTPGTLLAAYAATGNPVFDTVSYIVPGNVGDSAPGNTTMLVARVDYNITDNTQFFARYSRFDETDFSGFVNTSPYTGFETGQTNKNHNGMLSLSHTFTPNFLSNTRLTVSRLDNRQPLGEAPVGPTLYLSSATVARFGGIRVALPGYNEYTPGSAIPFGGPQNLIQLYQDLNWIKGKHTFRFGGQYIYTQDNRVFGAYEEAVEAFGTSSIGASSFENFLAGTLARFQAAVNPQGKFPCKYDPETGAQIQNDECLVTLPVGPPSFSRSNLYNDYALYAQDSWKVTPRLTLNLGLRWEYYGVQHNKNQGLDSNFYYGSGSNLWEQIRNGEVLIAGNSPAKGLWKPQKKNFGPRFGFAYDVFGDNKTSLRGGFGISFERNFNNVTYNVIQNPPAYAVLSITPADVGASIPVTTDNAGPLGGSEGSKYLPVVSLRHVDEGIKTAYTEQWNLGLERELHPGLVASLSYNGARGIHQYSISNINDSAFAQVYLGDTTPNRRLNMQYSNINNRGSMGDNYYHALVGSLRGSVKDVQFNANYTWSHSIDTLSSTFSGEVQNNGLGYLDPFNPGLDKGSSDYDARHRISLSAVVPLPFFKHSPNRFLKEALGGFSFSPVFYYRTGYPFTVFDCSSSGAAYNCPRAFMTPGATVPKGGSAGPDNGDGTFDYMTVPAAVDDYQGPEFITGTSTPMPVRYSNLPTCTGVGGQGCAFPSNMLPRSAFVGPGNWGLDFAANKDFNITERIKLQLRGEFFNILNHKNFYIVGFGAGGADVSVSPTVQAMKGGYGNPTDENRNVQLSLRVVF